MALFWHFFVLVLSIAVLVLVIDALSILEPQHTPKLNHEQCPGTSLDLSSCFFHFLRRCSAELIVLPVNIDRGHGGEDPTMTERYQMHSRRIRSKDERHQVDHGQTSIL
jgi:hypothetical protein